MDHKLVQSIPLFDGVKRRRQLELAALADEISVPAGTKLAREGAYAHEFFVIVDGEAEVVDRGATTTLATLGPGDFFGEIGLLDGPARSATVVAVTPMRLLVAGSREFVTLMHTFPGIAERVRAACVARTGTDASRRVGEGAVAALAA